MRPHLFASHLHTARVHFGNALCECRAPSLKLQIRERSGKLHLAAWPGQGGVHAFHCPFYSARDRAASSVEGFSEGQDGRIRVKYVSPLAVAGQAPRDPKPEPVPGTARMWALLHHLWMESGLNRWYPGWRRDWGLARHLLLREASEVEIEDTSLDRILYIPRVFTDRSKKDIDQEWQAFVRPLAVDSRGQITVRSAFVLGVVRTLTQSKNGYQVTLQQHAASIFIPENVCRSLSQRSRRGWSEALLMDGRTEAAKAKVVVMLRVQANRNAMLVAVDAVMMRATKNLIPSNTGQEDALATALLESASEFIRPLSFEQRHGDLPTFILRQIDGNDAFLTDLYCIPLSTPRHSVEQVLLGHANKAFQAGHGIWVWNRHEAAAMPKLPPPLGTTVS